MQHRRHPPLRSTWCKPSKTNRTPALRSSATRPLRPSPRSIVSRQLVQDCPELFPDQPLTPTHADRQSSTAATSDRSPDHTTSNARSAKPPFTGLHPVLEQHTKTSPALT